MSCKCNGALADQFLSGAKYVKSLPSQFRSPQPETVKCIHLRVRAHLLVCGNVNSHSQ
jgi:hypothetical protein